MRLVNPLQDWTVTLVGGQEVTVWADAMGGLEPETPDEPFTFIALMDIAVADQDSFEIVGRTLHDPERVVVLATFPRDAVARIGTLYPWNSDDPIE